MKKLLFALTLLAVTAAQADTKGYVRFEYYDEENIVTKQDNYAYALVPGMIVDKTWDFSTQLRIAQPELGNGAISSGVELRATRLFEAGSFKPYLSFRTGQMIRSATTFSQWNIVAGTRFPIAGSLSGDIGVRHRDAFESGHDFQTTRPHFGLNYAVTPKDLLGVRYARSFGDTELNQWRLSYTKSF